MKRICKIIGIFLAVIVLLYVIAMLPIIRAAQEQKLVAITKLHLEMIQRACNLYFDYYAQWPASLSELDHNRSNLVFIAWGGSGSNDSWGHPIIY